MKDCPSPGEMPLSRSAPSTDFAAALEVGFRCHCTAHSHLCQPHCGCEHITKREGRLRPGLVQQLMWLACSRRLI